MTRKGLAAGADLSALAREFPEGLQGDEGRFLFYETFSDKLMEDEFLSRHAKSSTLAAEECAPALRRSALFFTESALLQCPKCASSGVNVALLR